MDTVTLIRSGIRGVFKAAGADLEAQLRAVIRRDDDYATAGKPVCDYDDRAARKQLVDALAKDGTAVLVVLEGRELDPAATQASWNDAFGQSTAVRSTAPSAGGVQRAARQPDPGLFVAAAVGRNEDDRFDAHVPADVVRSYSAGRIRAGQPPGRAVPRVPGRPRPGHPPGRARRPAACAYRSVVGLPVPSGLVARTDEPVGASVRAKLRATSVTQLRHYWALSAAKPGRRLLIRVGE